MASLYSYEEEQIEQIPNQIDYSTSTASKHQTPQFHSKISKRQPLSSKQDRNMSFINKAQKYMIIKEERINHLKTQVQEKTMADCTFMPSINRNKSKNSRNLKEFLDFQANHLTKINEKNEILKNRIENEKKCDMTFSPKINRKKSYRNKENAYQRLYKLKDNNKDFRFEDFDHIPKITQKGEKIARNIPVQELLYQDAIRRQQKQNTFALQTDKFESQIPVKNSKNSKHAAQKFLKDFTYIVKLLKLQNNPKFNQKQFINILKHLGFAKYIEQEDHVLALKQRFIVKEAYQYLSQFKLTQSSLYVFLLAVDGIYDIEVGDGTVIEEQEGKKIHGYFDLLFRNRLFNDHAKRLLKSSTKQVNSYKPMINSESFAMAEKHRCRMTEKANQVFAKNDIDMQIPEKGLSHEDLLVIYNLSQNLQKQKLRQKNLQEKDPQCTFQPNHEKYHGCLSQNIGKQKCRQLYQQAKTKQLQCNQLNNTINLHNQQPFYNHKRDTLSPKASNISKNISKSQKQTIKSYLQIKDVDKNMARMMLGRQIRTQKKELQERGQPIITTKSRSKSRRNTKRVNEVEAERWLLLDVDVSIDNAYKKILIYSDEKHKIGQVVSNFCKRQGLDSDSQHMLQEQLKNALIHLEAQQNNKLFEN